MERKSASLRQFLRVRGPLKVRSSGRLKVKTRGIKKLFQEPRKVNRVTVAIIGTDRGSIIRQKIATKPAPSSRAASSSSLGIRLKKPVKSRIEVVCPRPP